MEAMEALALDGGHFDVYLYDFLRSHYCQTGTSYPLWTFVVL
jgi:hypothetical protein